MYYDLDLLTKQMRSKDNVELFVETFKNHFVYY